MAGARIRTFIIGCDYIVFHCYWRYWAQSTDKEICGFVYPFNDKPPIKLFKGVPRIELPVFSLSKLEKAIIKHRIEKCALQLVNISMPDLQSIINRILSTGSCSIELLPLNPLRIKTFKPLISIASLAPRLGKTQLGRYFCSVFSNKQKRISVILPIIQITQISDSLKIENCPHYEFLNSDQIPPNIFSVEIESTISSYQKSGAYVIYFTADVRNAIIAAEQCSEIIILDSNGCDYPLVHAQERICVVSELSLEHVRKFSLWPGLINIMSSQNIVVISAENVILSPSKKKEIRSLLKEQNFFWVFSHHILEDGNFLQMFDQKVLTIDQASYPEIAVNVARSLGASVDDRSITARIPSGELPSKETIEATTKALKSLSSKINTSFADVVLVNLPLYDFPDLDPTKQVIFLSPEIEDVDGELFNFLSQFFLSNTKPPLQDHFEAQVDIMQSFCRASEKELVVGNNDSYNREAFCRLFLSSHLPPGFRVTTGEIIDRTGNITGQLDVVVVNDDAPLMTFDSTGSVIAPIIADTVLAVVEVKTTLTIDSLKKALSQLRPVKALMPSHGTLTTTIGNIIQDPLDGKIISGVFSFRLANDIENKVPSIIALYPNVADFVVVTDGFCFFNKKTLDVCGLDFGNHQVVNGYVKFSSKGMGLALIFGMMNSLAAIRRFSASNCIRYLEGVWGSKYDQYNQSLDSTRASVREFTEIVSHGQPKEVVGQIHHSTKQYLDSLDSLAFTHK